MDGVKPGFPAQVLMIVFRLHAMSAEARHAGRPVWIVGHGQAGVTKGAEVFARIETETANSAQIACALALVFGSECLSGVFNYRQAMSFGNAPERFHLGTLPKAVHRHDGPGPLR